MYKLKKDKYKSARGGHSRLLDVSCEHCGNHIAYYQKDGPGILKRMYLDRMVDYKSDSKELACKECNRTVGVWTIYEKENRPAYRLSVGAVNKKIIKQQDLLNTSP